MVEYLDSFSKILSEILEMIPQLRCVDPVRLGSLELLQAFFGELKLKMEMSRSKFSSVLERSETTGTDKSRSSSQSLHNVVNYIDRLNSFLLHI